MERDTIAPRRFTGVKRIVGGFQGGVERTMGGVCNAQAHGDAQIGAVRQRDGGGRHPLAQPFAQGQRISGRGGWKQEGKFFTTKAAIQILLAQHLL